jgi:hypothetical protein
MKRQAFDADTVQIIGEAFDAAVRDLPQTEQPPLVREVIAWAGRDAGVPHDWHQPAEIAAFPSVHAHTRITEVLETLVRGGAPIVSRRVHGSEVTVGSPQYHV